MKTDILTQFLELRTTLKRERRAVETRLDRINQALGSVPPTAPTAPAPTRARRTQAAQPPKSAVSLKEAIVKVTSVRPLTKPEILRAVQDLGFRFQTRKPLNSISTIVYGRKPRFKNIGGKFSPMAAPAAPTPTASTPQAKTPAQRKGKLSAAGRANIVAAQKARWAKIHARKARAAKSAKAKA